MVVARSTSRIQVPLLAKNPEQPAPPNAHLPVRSETPAVEVPIAPLGTLEAPLQSDPLRPVAYVLGGVGIVGIGLGSYFGLRAISKNSDAEKLCPDNSCPDDDGLRLTSQAKDAAVVSNVAFGVGATTLAAGIVIFALTPARREAALHVSPWFDQRSAGIGVRGRL
jgi:serine/threonine-protein kinase